MKKLLPIFVFLLSAQYSFAQWKCFTPGNNQYFTNNYGYVKGMRIDSLTASGPDLVYHPYRTIRMAVDYYTYSGLTDSSGGSWLGKKVKAKTDGTFLFDNIRGDTIEIRTRANPGDNWVFFNDGTDDYYNITVAALDTMTFMGITDSIKRFTLTAYQNGVYAPADSFDNAEIILSKNHGFVQVPDLYNFPYHEPDSAYLVAKLDYLFYLSIIDPQPNLVNINWGMQLPSNTKPGKFNAVFRQISVPNPSLAQLGNGWNVGDVIHRTHCPYSSPWCVLDETSRRLDTIVQKNNTANGVEYQYKGRLAQRASLTEFYYFPDSGTISYPNNVFIRDEKMPEEIDASIEAPWIYYYLPADTSYCTTGALYHKMYTNFVYGQPQWNFYPSHIVASYKEGLGLVRYHGYGWDGMGGTVQNNTVKFFVRNGVPCGTDFVFPVSIEEQAFSAANVKIYPNPAFDNLIIETPEPGYQLSLHNTLGQTVYSKASANSKELIDVRHLSNGVYYLKIETKDGGLFNKKIIIQH